MRSTLAQADQMVLLLLTVWLGLGLAYIVSVLAFAGGISRVYSFLAALSVLGVAAGLLVGYMASYGLVLTLVRYVGGVGASIIAFILNPLGMFGFQDPVYQYPFGYQNRFASVIPIALSVAVGFITLVPRVAEVASAAVMLAGSLAIFELPVAATSIPGAPRPALCG